MKRNNERKPERQVPKILLTAEEAAWSIGVSLSKFHKLVSLEEIRVVRIGGSSRFRPQDLETFADRHCLQPREKTT